MCQGEFAAAWWYAQLRRWWRDAPRTKPLTQCGNLVFPEDVKVVWYHRKATFGDEITDGVVEIPVGAVAEFKNRSGLDTFEPGGPGC